MCTDLKKAVSISKEDANLSPPPEELNEVSKIEAGVYQHHHLILEIIFSFHR